MHTHKKKHKHKNQVVWSMITDSKKWYYLAVKQFTCII